MNTFTLESDLRQAKIEWEKARAIYDQVMARRDWRRAPGARAAYMGAWNAYEAAADTLKLALGVVS